MKLMREYGPVEVDPEPNLDLNTKFQYASICLWSLPNKKSIGQLSSTSSLGYECSRPTYVMNPLCKPINNQTKLSQLLFKAHTN